MAQSLPSRAGPPTARLPLHKIPPAKVVHRFGLKHWLGLALVLGLALAVIALAAPEDKTALLAKASPAVEAAFCAEVAVAMQPAGLRAGTYPDDAHKFWMARARSLSGDIAADMIRARAALGVARAQAAVALQSSDPEASATAGEAYFLRERMVACSNRAVAMGLRFRSFD